MPLVPSILAICWVLVIFIVDPPAARSRFKKFTGVELPKNARDLGFSGEGGGLADFCDTYFFQSTPDEVDRLIRDLGLEEDTFWNGRKSSGLPGLPLPGCPDFRTWQNSRHYHAEKGTGLSPSSSRPQPTSATLTWQAIDLANRAIPMLSCQAPAMA